MNSNSIRTGTGPDSRCTVMILDDERRTRDNLIRILGARDDCSVICSASDGKEGLELARRHRPQIVLSDIKMPVMDGIRFAFALKEIAPATAILFLTGYSDKEFLLSAIKLGVCDYIEKPIVLDELQEAVDRAVAHVRLEQAREVKRSRRSSTLKAWREEVESKLIIDLAENTYNPQILLERLRKLELKMPVYSPYYAAVLRVVNHTGERRELLEFVLKAMKMKCLDCGIDTITGLFSTHYAVMLIRCNEFSDSEAIQAILEQTIQVFGSNTLSPCSLYCGIGRRVPHLADIRTSFLEAMGICDAETFLERESLKEYREELHAASALPEEASSPDELEQALLFFEKQEQFALQDLKMYFAENIFRILSKSSVRGAVPAFGDVYAGILKTRSHKDLSRILADYFPRTPKTPEPESNYLVDNVHRIIQNECANTSLGTAWLAKKLGVSKSYLSNLYKLKTGVALIYSVNSYRVEKAKLLLRNPALKIYEIASQCGYMDENYFIRVFKKATGLTPFKYREGLSK